jgi:hypothetical protein
MGGAESHPVVLAAEAQPTVVVVVAAAAVLAMNLNIFLDQGGPRTPGGELLVMLVPILQAIVSIISVNFAP